MFTTSGDHQMLQYPKSQMMDQSIWKLHLEIAPNCPRCASPKTKFCYYNNYSMSQPRYFCKGCRRYRTKGGSLRNVPVGGSCRKNLRPRPAKLALSQANQVGLGYLRDHISSPIRSENGSVNMSPGGCDGPSEIDLADVFAKFLNNQKPENGKRFGEDSSSGTSCGSLEVPPPGSFDQVEKLMMEYQIPSDLVQEEDIEEFMDDQHSNLYELQELLDDEILPHNMISWNDHETNFPWQQGFGQVSNYNDEVKMATNCVTGEWSSMDLSSYGIFTRP